MCEQKTNKRHKWADVLIAIAEGREVQYQLPFGQWTDISNDGLNHSMNFSGSNTQWRVKPKIVRKYCYAYKAEGRNISVTDAIYTDDEHFCLIASKGSLNIEWFQRLDNSCVEVEES